MEALQQVIRAVESAEDFQSALLSLVQQVSTQLNCVVASVYLLDSSTERYVLAATQGLNVDMLRRAALPLSIGIVGRVGKRLEPMNLADANLHPDFFLIDQTGEAAFKGMLAVPVTHSGRVLAVLVVRQPQAVEFGQVDESFLITLAIGLAPYFAHALATGAFDHVLALEVSMVKLRGVPSASGIGLGVAVVQQSVAVFENVPLRAIAPSACESEVNRFREAAYCVEKQMSALEVQVSSRLSHEEMSLFEVYRRFLNDPLLRGEVEREILQGFQAQGALARVIVQHCKRFEQMEDAYLRARAVDIKDIGARLLRELGADAEQCPTMRSGPVVLIGEEISASTLLECNHQNVVGIATRAGSLNSHMAIIARSLGIPAVLGVADLEVRTLLDQEVIVDGDKGYVIACFDEDVRLCYLKRIERENKLWSLYNKVVVEKAGTADGLFVGLWLNTGFVEPPSKIDAAIEGVGLYRSELLFFSEPGFPTLSQQRQVYAAQLTAFAPRPVTIRTLDIGGDKSLPYMPILESNPFLGWRGIRVSLDYPQTFIVQVRAMLLASEGLNNLRILLPMVSTLGEVLAARAIVEDLYQQLVAEGRDIVMPAIGVMVEVPALVFQVEALATHVDFLSIGTNDLIQYLLAVDRNNGRVAHLYDPLHPSVLRVLQQIAMLCHKVQLPVTVCGEMAGDPLLALVLIALGYRNLSMSERNLLRVRWAIKQVTLSALEQLLEQMLNLDHAGDIASVLFSKLKRMGLGDLVPDPQGLVAKC